MLSDPSTIYLRGKVVYCAEHDINSHVISETTYHYRIAIQFSFESPVEEAALKKYCEDVQQALLPEAA